MRVRRPHLALLALLLGLLALLAPAAASAAPPLVTDTAFSQVTETSATIAATVDPNGGTSKAHFDLTTLAAYEEHEFQGATRLPAEDFSIPSAGGPQTISTPLSGLSPATGYVFRVVAKKVGGAQEEGQSEPPATFYTYGPAPTFGPCPNDELRSGALAAPGAPGALLPDCRSYELATPLEKNGNHARSANGFARAAADGSAITFGTPFGLPGGQGAQSLPFYQASRGASEWSTAGLLAPAGLGEGSRYLVGQLPDLSATYATVSRYDPPVRSALFELHRDGSAPTQITPFAPGEADNKTRLGFAGASADASTLVVQAAVALPAEDLGPPIEGSVPGAPNLYAWSRATGQLHLASVMNTAEETEEKLPKGAWAGPYNWVNDKLGTEGGTEGGYYLSDEHAVSEDGSLFFTSRSDGHLYERTNPTAPQSTLDSEGNCAEPAKACTLDLSASKSPPDPGGPQPAVFHAATADGSKVFFTSSEKLTADANTGPEQPPAQIGRATLDGDNDAKEVKEDFLPAHALGVTVDPKGEYVYWAEPLKGTIGRAKLKADGSGIEGTPDTEFIVPGETQAEVHQKTDPGALTPAATRPQYVAVDEEHVYWTNAGPLGEDAFGNQLPTVDGQGTIGRAKLKADGSGVEGTPDPEFIPGASNPQGIAVNATHIYWANAAEDGLRRTISRAGIDGGGVDEGFVPSVSRTRYGVALSDAHVYYVENETENNLAYLKRVPLAGGAQEGPFLGEAGLRGLALDSGHLYWATQGEGGAIGRISLTEFDSNCESNPTCEKHFLTPSGTLEGLATSGDHLFWSVNGESPGNPGNDLYRYEPGTRTLTDLTPKDSTDNPNGAEVRGVLGASADGSHVYFAANADLDGSGPAEQGDCTGKTFKDSKGECNVYLYHDGEYQFVARVATSPDGLTPDLSDAVDWLPQPYASALKSGSSTPKSSWVSGDGRTLVFRSTRALAPPYDNKGQMELYRFTVGGGIACLTCTPSGEEPIDLASGYYNDFLEALKFPAITPVVEAAAQVQLRFASADGRRAFFETPEALVASDTDGASGCQLVEGIPACLDVYEWEAPGAGSCSAGGPGYSPLNQGCLYLISQDSDSGASFFADASSSGEDVFFFTRAQLVGRDSDELLDVYDARVDGGLPSQNPVPVPPCEAEGCKSAAAPPPPFQAPPQFSGPSNPKPSKPCPKGKVRKHGKCVKKKARKDMKKAHRHHSKAHAGRRAGR